MWLVRFMSELAQRRVLRLAGFYTVGAWLILQIADVTFDPIGLPDWSMRYLVYLVFAGFLPALILGWRYDITAGRLVRAVPEDEDPSNLGVQLVPGDYLIIAALTAATFAIATLLFFNSLRPASADLPNLEDDSHSHVVALSVSAGDPGKSLFLRGVSASIATELSANQRISFLVGKSAEYLVANPAKACAALRPSSGCEVVILEDSDLEQTDSLQIRRFDAVTGETFDTRVVASGSDTHIESAAQLCEGVISVLRVFSQVDSTELCQSLLPTENSEALGLYYSAMAALLELSEEQTIRAKETFEAATQLDPLFGEAYAGLSIALLELVKYPGNPLPSVIQEARSALKKAEQFASGSWLTHVAAGYLHEKSGDFQAAADAYSVAVSANGGSPYLLERMYKIHDVLKNSGAALIIAKRLNMLDPLNAVTTLEIGSMALRLGDLRLAESALSKAVGLNPDSSTAQTKLAELYFKLRRCDKAEEKYRLGAELNSGQLARFRPENLDFEHGSDSWRQSNATFAFELDNKVVQSGLVSAKLSKPDAGKRESGSIWQALRPCEWQGKRVRFAGYAKTADVENSFNLYISARASPSHPSAARGRVLGSDFMEDRKIKGTTDWTRYELVFDVPEGTIWLGYGAVLVGPGTVWVDNLEIEEVDQSVPTTN